MFWKPPSIGSITPVTQRGLVAGRGRPRGRERAMVCSRADARSRLRLTSTTLAPSRANNMATAAPFPTPSACAAAPVTIATLPLSRPMRAPRTSRRSNYGQGVTAWNANSLLTFASAWIERLLWVPNPMSAVGAWPTAKRGTNASLAISHIRPVGPRAKRPKSRPAVRITHRSRRAEIGNRVEGDAEHRGLIPDHVGVKHEALAKKEDRDQTPQDAWRRHQQARPALAHVSERHLYDAAAVNEGATGQEHLAARAVPPFQRRWFAVDRARSDRVDHAVLPVRTKRHVRLRWLARS